FSLDLCEHTPYGCSKLAADMYVQDYAHIYGIKTGVFRMSCIYGTRQFGVEDQGWVAWFAIATVLGRPISIYGDGKQVRDALYVTDLVKLYDKFVSSGVKHGVYNTGGGRDNTLSLLELLDLLKELTGKSSKLSFGGWRPSDQKVFISDIRKAGEQLGWKPEISPREGVGRLVRFVEQNRGIF
ncbi:GDP-mannose 4,6-dehydratase, partial [Candidatus Woesearchaeota archaeon]|nr:GDP-mannose 4,6-dehydratase [Candidatus Woesearchaeota archaeon]